MQEEEVENELTARAAEKAQDSFCTTAVRPAINYLACSYPVVIEDTPEEWEDI